MKPPLGLTPKKIWQEERLEQVSAAVQRYYEAGLEIPLDWIVEYNELVRILKPRT